MNRQIGRNDPATRWPFDGLAMVKTPPPNPQKKRRGKPVRAEVPTQRKQPGRRYGPPPKTPLHAGMQSPKPMDTERRREIYRRGRQRMTARQERHFHRMAWRSDAREYRAEAINSIAYAES